MTERRASVGRILDIVSQTWAEGYVFFPWIPGKCRDKDERRAGYHEGPAFEWPKDRKKIEAHLKEHWNDDVYWCPNSFNAPQRLEQYASPERALYADLDEADPEDLAIPPTVAWESSPPLEGDDAHWQALWVIDGDLLGASWPGKENHRLTYSIAGADPSGWDTTQLLRLPGWPNHKPERRAANGGKPPCGRILTTRGPRYRPTDFADLPEVKHAAEAAEALEIEIDHIDRHKVWSKVRMKVPTHIRQYVLARDTAGADRSEVLWQIERELADAGLSPAEIVALVRHTVWNKYEGRNDELRRLTTEALKAVSVREEKNELEGSHDLEIRDRPQLPHEALANIRRPRWLVQDIWQQGSCGFVAGPPKAYKSYVTLDLAFSIASGLPFLGEFRVEDPRPVIYIQEEDPLPLIKQRYDEMVAGKDRSLHYEGFFAFDGTALVWKPPARTIPFYFYAGKGFKASDPAWQSWLDEMIEELKAGAVIIDTLGTAAGDVDVDRYHEVNDRILAPLKDLAHRQDCALAIVHHNAKNKDSLDGQAMLGSTAFHGWVEDALYFGYRDDGFRLKRESKLARPLYLSADVPFITRDDGWRPLIESSDSDPGSSSGRNKATEKQLDFNANGNGNGHRKTVPKVVKAIRQLGGSAMVEDLQQVTGYNRSKLLMELRKAADASLLIPGSATRPWRLQDAEVESAH